MSELISEEYRSQLEKLHEARADFGRQSPNWAGYLRALCRTLDTYDVLDYGCGKGELALHLPFRVKLYDPGMPKFSASPEAADILVSTDVLEHIEPELLPAVLAHMAAMTKRLAFIHIATRPAKKTLPDGRNAHLIVQPPTWWKVALMDVGFIVVGKKEYVVDHAELAVSYLMVHKNAPAPIPQAALDLEIP
jgi:SAM-dependent methyltransferase